MSSSLLSTFALVAVLGVVAISAFSVGFTTSAEEFDQAEQITLSNAGELVEAADIAVDFGANVTVTHNGSTLEEGVDYSFNESSGELVRLNGSSVPAGEDVQIDYRYNAPDDTTRDVNGVLGSAGSILPLLALLAAAFVVGGWLS